MANLPPSTPTKVYVAGQPESDEQATKSTGTVTVSAIVDDPNAGQKVRIHVRYSKTASFSSYSTKVSSYVAQKARAGLSLTGLAQNQHYWVRVYAQDTSGAFSNTYNAANFWTNRFPTEPEIVTPADNITFSNLLPLAFDWHHVDPDGDDQRGYEIRWKPMVTHGGRPGGGLGGSSSWTFGIAVGDHTAGGTGYTIVGETTDVSEYTAPAGTFRPNTRYVWNIRTQDTHQAWGEWSQDYSFYVEGTSTPPALLGPLAGGAVDVASDTTFAWLFRDPDPGDTQTKADLRYRVVGSSDASWVTLLGDILDGDRETLVVPTGTFAPRVHYEWQVRTYDVLSGGDPSEWSESGDFWTIVTPGSGNPAPTPPVSAAVQGSLGTGHNRVFVYDRGGQINRGEITSQATIQWTRKRDDISGCLISTTEVAPRDRALLEALRTWQYELVVFRDGVRVWEGPVTRIEYRADAIEIEAKDVMAWVYRRIMRQGYNDSYRVIDGQQIGLRSVVRRSSQIILDALARDDPNVIQYLTLFEFEGDAKQSRVVPDFSKMAWEEVDDLAATAGLDYTVVGRRIMLWDTHRSIGRLPELRDTDFSDPPVITEYGMQLANVFGVTNGNGVWGEAAPLEETAPGQFYGAVEQLATAYGESEGASADVLTGAARNALIESMNSQAQRNINGRWPAPLIVRVPDNTTLSPKVNLGINQIVPGVWIPLRSTSTLRAVSQWQKLDSMAVLEDATGEKVQVVMSPAPRGGIDPDAEASVEVT